MARAAPSHRLSCRSSSAQASPSPSPCPSPSPIPNLTLTFTLTLTLTLTASTLDPLFKADKVMIRAVPLVDPDNADAYSDAVDAYITKQQMSSTMAYTSSWSGIENPNGSEEKIGEVCHTGLQPQTSRPQTVCYPHVLSVALDRRCSRPRRR